MTDSERDDFERLAANNTSEPDLANLIDTDMLIEMYAHFYARGRADQRRADDALLDAGLRAALLEICDGTIGHDDPREWIVSEWHSKHETVSLCCRYDAMLAALRARLATDTAPA